MGQTSGAVPQGQRGCRCQPSLNRDSVELTLSEAHGQEDQPSSFGRRGGQVHLRALYALGGSAIVYPELESLTQGS